MEKIKTLVQEIEQLEQFILSGVLFNTEYLILDFCTLLKASDFQSELHKKIYNLIVRFWTDKKDNEFESSQLISYIEINNKDLFSYCISLIDFRDKISDIFLLKETIQRLKDLKITHKVKHKLNKTLLKIERNTQGLDIAFELQESINKIITEETDFNNDYINVYDYIDIFFNEYLQNSDKHKIKTNFATINNVLGGGFNKTNIVVIAGRTGHGKSLLAMNLINDFIGQGYKIGLVTLEMNENEVLQRLICINQGISFKDLKDNKNNSELKQKFKNNFVKCNLLISRKTAKEQIFNQIKLWKQKEKIDIVFIDYIGLISGKPNNVNRYEFISEISRCFKNLASEQNILIFVLAQLNRENEIAESLAIERDADFSFYISNKFRLGIKEFAFNNRTYSLTEERYLLEMKKSRHSELKTFVMELKDNFQFVLLELTDLDLKENIQEIENKRNYQDKKQKTKQYYNYYETEQDITSDYFT